MSVAFETWAAASCDRSVYDADIPDIEKVVQKTLDHILNHGKLTTLGRQLGVSQITSVEEYQQVPLTSYEETYRPLVERMLSGEENIMVPEKVDYFICTGGTTGKRKIFPSVAYTPKFQNLALSLQELTAKYNFSFGGCNHVLFKSKPVNPSRVWYTTEMTIYRLCMTPSDSWKWAVPRDLYMNDKLQKHFSYLSALCVLRRPDLQMIGSTFVTSVISFFMFVKENADSLIKDIENGTASIEEELPEGPLKDFLSTSDIKRANEIRESLQVEGFAKQLWPNLKVVMATTSRVGKYWEAHLQKLAPGVVIWSPIFGSTESDIIGVNIFLDEPIPRFVFLPRKIFVELKEKDTGIVKQIYEAEIGKVYLVIITTYSGLYRYQTDDYIQVVDFYKSRMPVFEFFGRVSDVVNFFGEQIPVANFRESLIRALSTLGKDLGNYGVFYDPAKVCHLLYVEPTDGEINSSQLDELLKNDLLNSCESFGIFFSRGRLTAPKTIICKKGTWMKLQESFTKLPIVLNENLTSVISSFQKD